MLGVETFFLLRGGKLVTDPGGWGDDQSYYEDEFVLHHHPPQSSSSSVARTILIHYIIHHPQRYHAVFRYYYDESEDDIDDYSRKPVFIPTRYKNMQIFNQAKITKLQSPIQYTCFCNFSLLLHAWSCLPNSSIREDI